MTELVCQVNRSASQAPQNPYSFAPTPPSLRKAPWGPTGPHRNPPEVGEEQRASPSDLYDLDSHLNSTPPLFHVSLNLLLSL